MPTELTRKIRILDKPRLILALLSELEATESIIIAKPVSSENRFACTLKIQFDDSQSTNLVYLSGADDLAQPLLCVAHFGERRIEFELDECGSSIYRLPKSVKIIDMRKHNRIHFNSSTHIVEIIGKNKIWFGVPVDINLDYAAIELASINDTPPINSDVILMIREVQASMDLYINRMSVVVTDTSTGRARTLLRRDPSRLSQERKEIREPIQHTSLVISKPGVDPYSCLVRFRDISLTGFSAEFDSYSLAQQHVPGMIFDITSLKVKAQIIWQSEKAFGAKIISLHSAVQLKRWMNFHTQARGKTLDEAADARDIAKVFVQSGFLKGKRRAMYGDLISKQLPVHMGRDNPFLFIRRIQRDESGEVSTHGSMVRIAEDAWLIQEGAEIRGEAKVFGQMLLDLFQTAGHLANASNYAPRYVFMMWDQKVKTTDDFAKYLQLNTHSQRFIANHFNASSFEKDVDSAFEITVKTTRELSADVRYAAYSSINPAFLEAVGGFDGRSPRLSADLASLGPRHSADCRYVLCGDQVIAFAHRIKSYYSLNATGVANSLFVILNPEITNDQFALTMASLCNESIMQGTDDILIIWNQDSSSNDRLTALSMNFSPNKSFNLILVDVLQTK